LSKFRCGQAIARQPLMVEPLQLLELVGFQSLEMTVDSFDRHTNP
jgi:hypothetical protein